MASLSQEAKDAIATDPNRSNPRAAALVRGPKGLGLRVIGVSHAKLEGPRGHYISFITPNTPASAAKVFRVGDEILSVNGKAVHTLLHKDALLVLTTASSPVTISVVQNDAGWQKFCTDDGLSPESLEDRQVNAVQAHHHKHMGVGISKAPGLSPPRAHESTVHSHTLTLSLEEGVDMLCKGVAALDDERFADAEKYLLKALHSVMDKDTADQIIAASRQPNPVEAQRQCNRIIDTHQKSKAGVHYLIGLAISLQGDVKRAQIPFTTAVKQCMQWHYTEGMVVDPTDPSFHYAVGTSLVAGNKHTEARMALKQACKLSPKPAWLKQLHALNMELGFALPDTPAKHKTDAEHGTRGIVGATRSPADNGSKSLAKEPQSEPIDRTPRRTAQPVLRGGVKSPPYAAYDMVNAYTKTSGSGLGSKNSTASPEARSSPKTVLQPPAMLRDEIPASSGSDDVGASGEEQESGCIPDVDEATERQRMEEMAQQQLADDMAAMQIEVNGDEVAVGNSDSLIAAAGGSMGDDTEETAVSDPVVDSAEAAENDEQMHF